MSWQNVVQTSRYETTNPNIVALYRLESDGTATVGNDHSINHTGSGGSYTHDERIKFGNCFRNYPTGGGSSAGYSYRRTTSVGNWASTLNWAVGKSWKVWMKVDSSTSSSQHFLMGFSDGGQEVFAIGLQNATFDTAWVFLNGALIDISFYSNASLVNLNDGKEHCIEFVSVASNDHRLYVDGILHDSSSTNISVLVGNEGNIGANGYGSGDSVWSGWEDELSCFSVAHTAKEAYAYGGALLC